MSEPITFASEREEHGPMVLMVACQNGQDCCERAASEDDLKAAGYMPIPKDGIVLMRAEHESALRQRVIEAEAALKANKAIKAKE